MTESEHAPVPRYLIPGLVIGLVAWGLYLAFGAAFPEVGPQPASQSTAAPAEAQGTSAPGPPPAVGLFAQRITWENFRPWRGAVVLVCSALFLAWFWGLQRIYVRRHTI